MRQTIIACIIWCTASFASVIAQDTFPYDAYIAADRVAARSGPGKVHYPTDRLEKGTKIEVYRHDPGGWQAVRPPDGSFSWVPASQVELTDESGVGKITGGEVTALIGTRVNSVKEHMWQVRLRSGELVEVLGEKQLSMGASESVETWYKIAPPPGEFRWIQASDISRQPPASVSTDQTPGWSAAKDEQVPTLATSASPFREVTTTSGQIIVGNQPTGQGTPTAPISLSPNPSRVGAPVSGANFEQQIRALDIQLSLMLARALETWQFGALRQNATALVGASGTDVQRGRARLLVDKIEKFETLKQRMESKSEDTTSLKPEIESEQTKVDYDDSPDAPAKGLGLVDDIDPRFDGLGYLMPVRSRQADAPPYALLNRDGKVLYFVTPAPGFNLHRYLKKEIGVYGQRGFIPDKKAPHVTVRNVVELERHRGKTPSFIAQPRRRTPLR